MQRDLRENPTFMRTVRLGFVLAKGMGYSLLGVLWFLALASLGLACYAQEVLPVPSEAARLYQLSAFLMLLGLALHALAGIWPFHVLRRKGWLRDTSSSY